MRRIFLIGALVACAVVAWAGKGGGGKPPKDPPPPSDPAIAYNEVRKFGGRALMVANADGSNQTIVAHADNVGSMSWSHDNSQLCFDRTVEGLTDVWGLYRINVDGTGETLLYEYSQALHLSGNPDWSPVPAGDGEYKIAFQHPILEPDGTYTSDIFLINRDGTGLTNLTNTPGIKETRPSWSWDGLRMAVMVHTGVPGANLVLYVLTLTADGTEVSSTDCPTDQTGAPWNGVARWAKTRDKLVVSPRRPGNKYHDLWVIDFTYPATVITQVTDTPDFDENVADWSEDDSSFIFMGTSWTYRNKWRTDWGAWVMPSDGSAEPVWLLPDARMATGNGAVRWRR
jgi:Tol biopolymer transport system component